MRRLNDAISLILLKENLTLLTTDFIRAKIIHLQYVRNSLE